jgi:hypothetical protein
MANNDPTARPKAHPLPVVIASAVATDVMIEQLAHGQLLLVPPKGKERIGASIEHAGTIYQPARLDPALEATLNLPATVHAVDPDNTVVLDLQTESISKNLRIKPAEAAMPLRFEIFRKSEGQHMSTLVLSGKLRRNSNSPKRDGRSTAWTTERKLEQSQAMKLSWEKRRGDGGAALAPANSAADERATAVTEPGTVLQPSEIISRGEVTSGPTTADPLLMEISQLCETPEDMRAYAKKATDDELIRITRSVGAQCRNAVQTVEEFKPVILEFRHRYSRQGRVSLPESPTWSAFVPQYFGFTVRRMNQLLASPGEEKPERKRKTKAKRTLELTPGQAAAANGSMEDHLPGTRKDLMEMVYPMIYALFDPLRRTDPEGFCSELRLFYQVIANRLQGDKDTFAVRFDDVERVGGER